MGDFKGIRGGYFSRLIIISGRKGVIRGFLGGGAFCEAGEVIKAG